MKLIRTTIAVLLSLAFILSSAIGHAHPTGDSAPSAMHMQHGMDHSTGSNHHTHAAPAEHRSADHADLPNCCSMGACGTSDLAIPLTCLFRLDTPPFAPPYPARNSVTAVPEAPPPRLNG